MSRKANFLSFYVNYNVYSLQKKTLQSAILEFGMEMSESSNCDITKWGTSPSRKSLFCQNCPPG